MKNEEKQKYIGSALYVNWGLAKVGDLPRSQFLGQKKLGGAKKKFEQCVGYNRKWLETFENVRIYSNSFFPSKMLSQIFS